MVEALTLLIHERPGGKGAARLHTQTCKAAKLGRCGRVMARIEFAQRESKWLREHGIEVRPCGCTL